MDSRLMLAQVKERQHCARAPHVGSRFFGDVDLTLRTPTGELVKLGKRWCVEGCGNQGFNLGGQGVQALVCKPLLSGGGYRTMGGVAVMHGDRGCSF